MRRHPTHEAAEYRGKARARSRKGPTYHEYIAVLAVNRRQFRVYNYNIGSHDSDSH